MGNRAERSHAAALSPAGAAGDARRRLRIGVDFLAQSTAARLWDGRPVPAGLQARVTRVWQQLELLDAQLDELETARRALAVDPTTTGRYVERLTTLTA
jgi:hypothetical protein